MSYVEQAKQYILEGKSFRMFETECDVPADQSGEAWAKADAAIHKAKEEAWAKEDAAINNTEEKEFTVTWTIEMTAEDVEQAAIEALQMMRDPNSEATFFDVTQNGEPKQKTETVWVEQ